MKNLAKMVRTNFIRTLKNSQEFTATKQTHFIRTLKNSQEFTATKQTLTQEKGN